MTLIPAYLAPINYFKSLINQKELQICINTNYQKQTYRNRCVISSCNGLQKLTIPITHDNKIKRDRDVMIHNEIPWQKNHWKSIETAYKSSPFYEYYQDELKYFFLRKYKFLFDFNIEIMAEILELLELNINIKETNKEIDLKKINQILDPKKEIIKFKSYNQVFQNKNDFQSDLSIIDVLFNIGPETTDYIRSL